jgi:hypothetical protein
LHVLAEAQVTEDRLKKTSPPEAVEIGDWVIYYLSTYEKGVLSEDLLSAKYKPNWSLPARVTSLKDKAITVLPWGAGTTERQVPLAQVRKLTGTVPAVLVADNLRLLEKYQPRAIRHWALRKGAPQVAAPSWDELTAEAVVGSKGPAGPPGPAQESKKRKKLTAYPHATIRSQEKIGR